jgi:uncharacterized membrane protein
MARGKKTLGLRLNLFMLRLARHWLRIVLVFLGIYVSLPFAAPTLMHLGFEGPARAIYFVYGPFCHQFAFRSFFLFGDQYAYPRYNTGTDLTPFEMYVAGLPEFDPGHSHSIGGPVGDLYAFTPGFQFTSRDFLGNEQMGYKLALCERDMATYMAMFLGGLAYTRVRKRLRPAPFLLYGLLGVGPMAIDGLSQMFGYPPFQFWPPRETLPIFRVLTGTLFGLMNVWLGFPYLERAMADTRREVEAKLMRAGIQF